MLIYVHPYIYIHTYIFLFWGAGGGGGGYLNPKTPFFLGGGGGVGGVLELLGTWSGPTGLFFGGVLLCGGFRAQNRAKDWVLVKGFSLVFMLP